MQIKTTLYDLIGHIIPGLAFLVVLFVGYNHSIQCHQPLTELREYIVSLTAGEIVVFVLFTYLAGHFLSTISAVLVEGLLSKMPGSARFNRDREILGENLYKTFAEKFQKTFGCEPQQKDFNTCVCYVEAKQPAIYSTAMVFRSFCGMARNLTLVLMAYSLCEIINWVVIGNSQSAQYLIAALVAGLISFCHYLRFLRYFRRRILNGFIVP
jgi:hypothetical protein